MMKIVLLMKKYTGLQKIINLIKPFYLVTIMFINTYEYNVATRDMFPVRKR